MFGSHLSDAADKLKHLLPPEDEQRDWSVDAAILLALVYALLRRMEGRGMLFRLGKKLIVFPTLERLWQELIHIRIRMRSDVGQQDIDRPFTVTRTGRVTSESRFTSRFDPRDYWDDYGDHQDRQRDAGARAAARYRSRRDRRGSNNETPGSNARGSGGPGGSV